MRANASWQMRPVASASWGRPGRKATGIEKRAGAACCGRGRTARPCSMMSMVVPVVCVGKAGRLLGHDDPQERRLRFLVRAGECRRLVADGLEALEVGDQR